MKVKRSLVAILTTLLLWALITAQQGYEGRIKELLIQNMIATENLYLVEHERDGLLQRVSNLEQSLKGRVTFEEFKVTAYCACKKCTGSGKGVTRSGARVEEGVTIAVDPTVIPLGTRVYIDGLGFFVAQDTGGAVKGNRIDVFFQNHKRAEEFGVQRIPVAIYH